MEIKNKKDLGIIFYPCLIILFIFIFHQYEYNEIIAGDFLFYKKLNHSINTLINTASPGLDSMNIAFNYFPIYQMNDYLSNIFSIKELYRINFSIFSILNFYSAYYLFKEKENKNLLSLIYVFNPITFFYFFYYNFWVNLIYVFLPVTIKLIDELEKNEINLFLSLKLIILFILINYGITNPGYFVSYIIFLNLIFIRYFSFTISYFIKGAFINILLILCTLKTISIMFLALTEIDSSIYINQTRGFLLNHTVDYLSTLFFVETNNFIFTHSLFFGLWAPLIYYFVYSFRKINFYHFAFFFIFIITTKFSTLVNQSFIIDGWNNLLLGSIRNYQKTNLYLPILFIICIASFNFKSLKYFFIIFLIFGTLSVKIGKEHFVNTPLEYSKLVEIDLNNDENTSKVAVFPVRYAADTWSKFTWGGTGYNFIVNYVNAPFISYFYPYLEKNQKFNEQNILKIFKEFNINYILFHKDKDIPLDDTNEQLILFEKGSRENKFLTIEENKYYNLYKINE